MARISSRARLLLFEVLAAQVRAFIEADDAALARAGADETVDAGVISLEEDARLHLEHMRGPHIDHAAVAEHRHLLPRVRRNNFFDRGDDRRLERAHVYAVATRRQGLPRGEVLALEFFAGDIGSG